MALDVTVIPCLSDNYGYLLHDTAQDVWAVVDAPEAAPLKAAIDAAGGKLDWILITHHHADHIDGVAALVEAYGAKTLGHAADKGRLPALDVEVSEGDEIAVGAGPSALYYDVPDGEAYVGGDHAGPIPAAFPKGTASFYVMKYPITQGQYSLACIHIIP